MLFHDSSSQREEHPSDFLAWNGALKAEAALFSNHETTIFGRASILSRLRLKFVVVQPPNFDFCFNLPLQIFSLPTRKRCEKYSSYLEIVSRRQSRFHLFESESIDIPSPNRLSSTIYQRLHPFQSTIYKLIKRHGGSKLVPFAAINRHVPLVNFILTEFSEFVKNRGSFLNRDFTRANI